MKTLATIATSGGLLLFLLALGTLDLLTTKIPIQSLIAPENLANTPEDTRVVIPKKRGPDIVQKLTNAGYELRPVLEQNILQQIVPPGTPVQYRLIMQEGDRLGYVVWTETPSAKAYFVSLKEALLTFFSPAMEDLSDKTLREEGRPVVNIVSFHDPAISEERISFIRTQQRIFELHEALGKSAEIEELIAVLLQGE